MRNAPERIPFYVIDAFTNKPFTGNPAAVCIIKKQYEDRVLQSIAAEFNLSETAFLLEPTKKPIEDAQYFSLRWFTPTTEVPLCGHATLATAAVLFHEIDIHTPRVTFDTRSGELTATREQDCICLNFPSAKTEPIRPNQNLLRKMGIIDYDDACLAKTLKDLLIRLKNEETLVDLEPNFDGMKSISTPEDINGVIVTAKGQPPYDFLSRVFVPWLGINEDPVTGAAHTILAPYWSSILGKKEMSAYQASSRGGELKVRVHETGRVDLIGRAIFMSTGELNLYENAHA
ncbi:MAG: PhzF family phenazine biosynthesis isomerase [Candidatus Bathyarchaeota archaeon]|nr:MAG: PhzF family phenazine biosynthesis isomerase [Candidatus Bathyarchaeota archaeon]